MVFHGEADLQRYLEYTKSMEDLRRVISFPFLDGRAEQENDGSDLADVEKSQDGQ